MEYDEQQSAVTYHSDKPIGPTAGSETTDALEFLARLTSHIPDKGQVLRCAETMRIVSFITEHKTIDRIIEHLQRTQATRRRQRAPPRRWKSTASKASA